MVQSLERVGSVWGDYIPMAVVRFGNTVKVHAILSQGELTS